MLGVGNFSKQQRRGLIVLIVIILAFQIFIFYFNSKSQPFVDTTFQDSDLERIIDSIKNIKSQTGLSKVYNFNPNYISDYRGYLLGLSLDEIDRLHAYREKGLFVNSAKEFQEVTKIAKPLLDSIAPLFKFPKWVQDKKKKTRQKVSLRKEKIDLNTASAKQLKVVNGIGEVLSKRIVKFRKKIGGFLTINQLYEVYGLKSEVIAKLLKQFKIITYPTIKPLEINTTSAKELSKIYFISYDKALEIITYRTRVGRIKKINELKDIIRDSLKMKLLTLYIKV